MGNLAQSIGSVDWASWVQAIGSMVGIAIAIAIPGWQRKKELRDRQTRERDEARSLTLALFAPMMGFAENVKWRYVRVVRDRQGLASMISELKLPNALYERLHELHKFGPGAQALQSVVYWFSRIDSKRIEINSAEIDGQPVSERGRIFVRAGIEDLRRLHEACTYLRDVFDQLLGDFFVQGLHSTSRHLAEEQLPRAVREAQPVRFSTKQTRSKGTD